MMKDNEQFLKYFLSICGLSFENSLLIFILIGIICFLDIYLFIFSSLEFLDTKPLSDIIDKIFSHYVAW